MNRYVQTFMGGQWVKIDTLTNSIIWKRNYPWVYPRMAAKEYVDFVKEIAIKRVEHYKDIEYALFYGSKEA